MSEQDAEAQRELQRRTAEAAARKDEEAAEQAKQNRLKTEAEIAKLEAETQAAKGVKAGSAGGETITEKSHFVFWGRRATYLGGVALSYVLAEKNGAVIMAGTKTAMWQTRYKLGDGTTESKAVDLDDPSPPPPSQSPPARPPTAPWQGPQPPFVPNRPAGNPSLIAAPTQQATPTPPPEA